MGRLIRRIWRALNPTVDWELLDLVHEARHQPTDDGSEDG